MGDSLRQLAGPRDYSQDFSTPAAVHESGAVECSAANPSERRGVTMPPPGDSSLEKAAQIPVSKALADRLTVHLADLNKPITSKVVSGWSADIPDLLPLL